MPLVSLHCASAAWAAAADGRLYSAIDHSVCCWQSLQLRLAHHSALLVYSPQGQETVDFIAHESVVLCIGAGGLGCELQVC